MQIVNLKKHIIRGILSIKPEGVSMKCAKCGCDVPLDAEKCPGCSAGFRWEKNTYSNGGCPVCGSTEISAFRRTYSPGCGCLGLLLFGWWGLLMGLLGTNRVDLVCRSCGAVWQAGRPGSVRRRSGCGTVIVLLLLILLLKFIFAG